MCSTEARNQSFSSVKSPLSLHFISEKSENLGRHKSSYEEWNCHTIAYCVCGVGGWLGVLTVF